MRRYLKLNLVGSSFWQLNNDNTYTKRNYESHEELLNNVFFEELPNGIFKEITTGDILIIKSENDTLVVDYPRGVEVPMSNITKSNSLEIKLYLSRIRGAKLENEYKNILEELLVKSQQCELVCDKKKLKEEFWLLLPYFLVLAVATFFILVLQKDLGQVVVLAVTLMVLGTFAGTSKRFFAILSGGGVLLLIAAIITQPHRIRRFQSWWVTNQDAILKILPSEWAQQLYITGAEEPYQITHSLNAIYHGGFFGTGLGGGTFKLGFLSEVHTDFVLAGIAEEIGFIGLIGVSAILLFIIFRILKISSRSFNNNVYHLFSLGIAVIITVAFLMNAYGITSLIPIKGIAVPFLSYGGSSVLALSIAVGMVLMVSKKVDLS